MIKKGYLLLVLINLSCTKKNETIIPTVETITESIYASGIVKSKNQYQAFVTINGNIEDIFVKEGEQIKKGEIILTVSNEAQKLNKDNAELLADYSNFDKNKDKLNESKQLLAFAKEKLINDSLIYVRQQTLWQDKIGTKVEFESKKISYENSKTNYFSAYIKYNELKRQLKFNASQSLKSLSISKKIEEDYILKSKIDGVVYYLYKKVGEIVNPQTPLAIIGNSDSFVLEMQVDEFDIFKIKKDLSVLITLDSYEGQVFEAKVTKIVPFMNERTKTFLVEAEFIQKPTKLYPNVSFEANIILQKKQKALLIPRNYVVNDSFVINRNGEFVKIKTGLKDFQKIEIINGINSNTELQKPQ